MNKTIPFKQIEIFCGTGGVGKTTLATSRAVYLASHNKKVLLITIDPAKRLKQILSLDEGTAGQVQSVSSNLFKDFKSNNEFFIDALLMNPKETILRIGRENGTTKDLENPIIEILTRPNGGMNEIMAIIECQYQLSLNKYDSIILDTPPGKHFIDFLESSRKIQNFFDKSFLEIFKFLGKKVESTDFKAPKRFVSLIVSSGVKKLLSYLEKVTGESFVETFIDAIIALYKNRESFISAINFQDTLAKQSKSNWFLVTSVEQSKISEASELQEQAETLMHGDNFLAINKCLGPYLESWSSIDNETLDKLKDSMRKRESELENFADEHFENIIKFPEVFESSPASHVSSLASKW